MYTHDDDGDDDDHDHDRGKDDDNDDDYDYDDVKIMVNDVVCWCYITQKSCGNTFIPGLAELIWFIYILDLID